MKQYLLKNNTLRKIITPIYVNIKVLIDGVDRLIVKYKNQNAIFLIVPKNANSSINALFLKKNNIEFDINNYQDIHVKREQFMITTKDLINCKKCFKFAFVRNPFDRLVSFYKNKIVDEREYSFERYPFLISHNLSFKQFVNRLLFIPNIMADNHFINQSLILYDNNKLIVDYVGRYEDIDNDFEIIRRKYKLDKLPHFNKADNNDWMNYYDIDSATKVYKYYKDDFDKWYPDAYIELINFINNKNEKNI